MPKVILAGDTERGRENREIEVEQGEVVFNAYEDKGIELPHGCLSGSCGACRIEILEGEQNLSAPGPVELDTINHLLQEYTNKYGESFIKGKIIRLACRARIQGDFCFKTIES